MPTTPLISWSLLNDKIQHIKGVTETETLISLEQSMNRQITIKLKEGKYDDRHEI